MSETTNESTMDTTEHIGLKKPGPTDPANIEDINDNMDLIDAAIYALQNVGPSNEGKFMIVAADGTVTPTTVPFANGGSF